MACRNGSLERQIERSQKAHSDAIKARQPTNAQGTVFHDSCALQSACQEARDNNIPLNCLYTLSPTFDGSPIHRTARRSDAMIPNAVEARTRTTRSSAQSGDSGPTHRDCQSCSRTVQSWDANHLFANLEYEVDELRREALLIPWACRTVGP